MVGATANKPGLAHVAVVILNYNGWQDTLDCVRSLLNEGSALRVSIVVCDNASPNGSLARLREGLEAWPNAHAVLHLNRQAAEAGEGAALSSGADATTVRTVLIDNGGNLGFAGGCNVGMRWALAAGCDYFWLLNNDTEVAPGAMGALIDRMTASPQLGLCGSKLIYHDDRQRVQARGGAVFDPLQAQGTHIGVGELVSAPEDAQAVEAHMDYVIGASMLASRAFVQRVGLMTEDYFLYYEELDWAMRGKQLGFKLGYAPASVVYHKEGATIGTSHRRKSSSLAMRYLSRNRLLFTRRFHAQHLWSVKRRMVFEVLVFLKRREFGSVAALLRALLGIRAA